MALFIKNLLFVLVAPGTAAIYVPLYLARGRAPAGPPLTVLAAALFVVGGAIYLWCVWDFAAYGRGTPAPIDAPRRLVTRGLYTFTRNPMYVGVITVILGWTVLFQSARLALYAVAIFAFFNLFILLYEEPHLRRVFGREYETYCAEVGRWLPATKRRPAA